MSKNNEKKFDIPPGQLRLKKFFSIKKKEGDSKKKEGDSVVRTNQASAHEEKEESVAPGESVAATQVHEKVVKEEGEEDEFGNDNDSELAKLNLDADTIHEYKTEEERNEEESCKEPIENMVSNLGILK